MAFLRTLFGIRTAQTHGFSRSRVQILCSELSDVNAGELSFQSNSGSDLAFASKEFHMNRLFILHYGADDADLSQPFVHHHAEIIKSETETHIPG